jgi:hypothetical protein
MRHATRTESVQFRGATWVAYTEALWATTEVLTAVGTIAAANIDAMECIYAFYENSIKLAVSLAPDYK